MRSAVSARPTVLLLGNYRPTIALARALGGVGHRVIVGSCVEGSAEFGRGSAEFSRFAAEVWWHPSIERHPDGLIAALRAFLSRRRDVGVVFPVAEHFVRLVSERRDALPADRVYVLPPLELVATMLDKVAAYRLAEAAGLPVAPWARIDRFEELGPCSARLGYPIVVRPLGPARLEGRKALIADAPADLARMVPVWPPSQPALLLQRKVEGRRYNLYFAAQRGRLVRVAAAEVHRTDSPDGTGLAVTGRTVPVDGTLRGYTETLVDRLAYHGVGCAQYIVAPGCTTFLELNPRIGGNHAIPEAAGLDLSSVAVVLATAGSPDVPVIEGRPDIVFAWTHGDLAGLRTAIRRGTLSPREALAWGANVVRTFATADLHLTWRWDDPLPTLVPYARRIPGLGRVFDGRPRAARPPETGYVPLDETHS